MTERKSVAFVGSVGVPARYGGFETFVQELAPRFAERGIRTAVSCDATQYSEHPDAYRGCELIWIGIKANGMWSVVHDLVALLRTAWRYDVVVILGVSGGACVPLVRMLSPARLVVNIDGVEWRRAKFNWVKRALLKTFDRLAQLGSHAVIVDNRALLPYVLRGKRDTVAVIPYGGEHARYQPLQPEMAVTPDERYALTVCRIEPENNIDLLIAGFLRSGFPVYTIVGNWNNSEYGRRIRQHYSNDPRLRLLDPIYEAGQIGRLRAGCSVYVHGHSVGGTNPSLVEMLFFDCPILAYDCSFNRETALDAARYFSGEEQLAAFLDAMLAGDVPGPGDRIALRTRYSWDSIVDQYAQLAGISGECGM